ncbi:iron-regulated protein A precursor [Vibrio ishigakensis]|uniref:Iron-regulated protein A n=1 Tax=Vibrio ishigakensis TaxID=1481914 RepID=A0A0B8P083_9VIBR|nr:iron-regulated protein A precursor [Vibrio ishigakensis]
MQRLPLVIAMSLASATALAQTKVTQDQVVEHYADIAHAVYQDSRITAEELQKKLTH